MSRGRVKLNVGGKIFETTVETLTHRSTYFNSLFNNGWSLDEREPYFIDRSPGIFKHVLSLLRDPKYTYPFKYLSELEFYGIDVSKEMKYEYTGLLGTRKIASMVSDIIGVFYVHKVKLGLCGEFGCTSNTNGSYACDLHKK